MRVHAEAFYWLILPPFSGWLQKFCNTDKLFPWLVQGGYLNHLLQYFLYARTITKCWCSVGMFFNRCTNCKFINWYPDVTIWILVQCTVFLTEKNLKYYHTAGILRESTEISASEELNALEKAPAQFMALRILSGKGEVQFMPFRKLSGKCHFLLQFCASNWSETYISAVSARRAPTSPEQLLTIISVKKMFKSYFGKKF